MVNSTTPLWAKRSQLTTISFLMVWLQILGLSEAPKWPPSTLTSPTCVHVAKTPHSAKYVGKAGLKSSLKVKGPALRLLGNQARPALIKSAGVEGQIPRQPGLHSPVPRHLAMCCSSSSSRVVPLARKCSESTLCTSSRSSSEATWPATCLGHHSGRDGQVGETQTAGQAGKVVDSNERCLGRHRSHYVTMLGDLHGTQLDPNFLALLPLSSFI